MWCRCAVACIRWPPRRPEQHWSGSLAASGHELGSCKRKHSRGCSPAGRVYARCLGMRRRPSQTGWPLVAGTGLRGRGGCQGLGAGPSCLGLLLVRVGCRLHAQPVAQRCSVQCMHGACGVGLACCLAHTWLLCTPGSCGRGNRSCRLMPRIGDAHVCGLAWQAPVPATGPAGLWAAKGPSCAATTA